jgi:beta-glucosidase
LSYTTFSYSDLKLSKTSLKDDETLVATVTVSNSGTYAGEETAQLYLTQPAASVTRSVEDLRGFQKVSLKPGESKKVAFQITPEDLKFYNRDLAYDWEPGEFIVRIGADSARLTAASVRWSKNGVLFKN